MISLTLFNFHFNIYLNSILYYDNEMFLSDAHQYFWRSGEIRDGPMTRLASAHSREGWRPEERLHPQHSHTVIPLPLDN